MTGATRKVFLFRERTKKMFSIYYVLITSTSLQVVSAELLPVVRNRALLNLGVSGYTVV